MMIKDAAKKWKISPGWVRALLHRDLIPGATLNKSGPVPYYEIPDDTVCPKLPKGPSPEAVARRRAQGKKPKAGKKKAPRAVRKARQSA